MQEAIIEPITIALLGTLLWDNLGQPIVDKVKDRYAEKVYDKVDNALSNTSFKNEEKKLLEAEIIKFDDTVFQDKETFIKHIRENKIIQNMFTQHNHTYNITIQGDVKGVVTAESGSVITQTIS